MFTFRRACFLFFFAQKCHHQRQEERWETRGRYTQKQRREKRLEARQLLGNLTLIEVMGQIIGSLVEENDRACR